MNDFDWPPIPYSEFLQQELQTVTQYEYINPALHRRYDPVVVGGNAMHPVIQSGDVILIDRKLQIPEDGQAVAVRVCGNRTVIGYWRATKNGPVLEQERTDTVINLSDYASWQVYGVITKIIGRGIPQHAVRCAEEEARMDVTPGQAQYVIERLLAERRISPSDVQGYVAEIGKEIESIETRLASLRDAAPPSPTPKTTAPSKPRTKTAKKGHPRGIAGTLAVLLRSIPAAEHAAIQAIRERKGIRAAIDAAKRAAK